MPRRAYSFSSYTATPCIGVTASWTQCGQMVAGGVCYSHTEQARWLRALHIDAAERKAHALGRRCCGLIKDNSRLCNNRVAAGAFKYCHFHCTHGPPSWKLPDESIKGLSSNDPRHLKLRDKLLELVKIKADLKKSQDSSKSSGFKAKAEDPPMFQGYHYFTSDFFQEHLRRVREEFQRREREEKEKAKKKKSREDERGRAYKGARAQEDAHERREQQQQKAEEKSYRRSGRSGASTTFSSSYFFRSAPPLPIRTAYSSYKSNLTTFSSTTWSSAGKTASFSSVPWPVLVNPSILKPEDILSSAAAPSLSPVAKFFDAIGKDISVHEMMEALGKARIAFHPTRFAGRGVFSSIVDKDERNVLESCVNEVSKVVNHLYDVKGGR